MTCEECEKEQESGRIAYFRIEEANIGLIGCEKHLKIAIDRLREFRRG